MDAKTLERLYDDGGDRMMISWMIVYNNDDGCDHNLIVVDDAGSRMMITHYNVLPQLELVAKFDGLESSVSF